MDRVWGGYEYEVRAVLAAPRWGAADPEAVGAAAGARGYHRMTLYGPSRARVGVRAALRGGGACAGVVDAARTWLDALPALAQAALGQENREVLAGGQISPCVAKQ